MARRIRESSVKLLLAAVVVLLAANLVLQASLGTARSARAAGLPDTGAQFQAIVDEIRTTNKHLDTIEALLNSGNITVKTRSLDKDSK